MLKANILNIVSFNLLCYVTIISAECQFQHYYLDDLGGNADFSLTVLTEEILFEVGWLRCNAVSMENCTVKERFVSEDARGLSLRNISETTCPAVKTRLKSTEIKSRLGSEKATLSLYVNPDASLPHQKNIRSHLHLHFPASPTTIGFNTLYGIIQNTDFKDDQVPFKTIYKSFPVFLSTFGEGTCRVNGFLGNVTTANITLSKRLKIRLQLNTTAYGNHQVEWTALKHRQNKTYYQRDVRIDLLARNSGNHIVLDITVTHPIETPTVAVLTYKLFKKNVEAANLMIRCRAKCKSRTCSPNIKSRDYTWPFLWTVFASICEWICLLLCIFFIIIVSRTQFF
ncbi:membrane protein A22 [Saimiriine betaherpesvirus 4]|uniref:Membrane protein A22 n=1 Tax=Saimiriine betaherpesvirus 4 TaxID=1535247 RepID=G8XT26_9BETA|nr:membrane protein A22 [Saimiriine betaherpesvirus 4]AEV80972.1 membrane protein A22 [Saimiriine betaherpesvirus 4]